MDGESGENENGNVNSPSNSGANVMRNINQPALSEELADQYARRRGTGIS